MLLCGAKQTGRLVPGGDAQALTRLAQVIDDRVVGDPQAFADFLAVEVFVDQTQNLTFALRQPVKADVPIVAVPIHGEITCRPVKGCWSTYGAGCPPEPPQVASITGNFGSLECSF